jgi:hypothetical protein
MSPQPSGNNCAAPNRVRPRLEALEDRSVPAVVTTTLDSPTPGSLRAAILEANTTPGPDTITFLLGPADPGRVYYLDDGVAGRVTPAHVTPAPATDDDHLPDIDPDWRHSWWSIRPLTPLPEVTEAVSIDGTTQPSGRPNESPELRDSYLRVELDGEAAGPADGLVIGGGSSKVRGLAINRFGGSGIHLRTAGGNVIARDYVGTDISGTLDLGNAANGVLVSGGSGNLIGGPTGTPGTGAGNVISGNDANGISVDFGRIGPRIEGTVVQGNIIGLDASGTKPLGNTHAGFRTRDTGALIGGTDSRARNVISSNETGIQLSNSGSDLGAVIQGNYVGTDIAGNLDLGNRNTGVGVGSAPGTRVGGTVPGAGNVISGNRTGVFVHGISHPVIDGRYNCLVQGNVIGLNAAGTAAVGNGTGVLVINGDNLVGGTAAGARNVISGNRGHGVHILHATATGNQVLGNIIGTDVTRFRLLGNLADGILISDGAAANVIDRNWVAFNGRDGISLDDADGNTVRANVSLLNCRDGLRVDARSADNKLVLNLLLLNAEHDAHDESVGGGTAGTANLWLWNVGLTENRPGLLI